MSATFALLSGVTTDTTGSAFELPVVGRTVGWVAHLAGAGGFGSVIIQGSFDSTIWFAVASAADPASGSFDMPIRYVRAAYSADGTTGPATVQAIQSDEDG